MDLTQNSDSKTHVKKVKLKQILWDIFWGTMQTKRSGVVPFSYPWFFKHSQIIIWQKMFKRTRLGPQNKNCPIQKVFYCDLIFPWARAILFKCNPSNQNQLIFGQAFFLSFSSFQSSLVLHTKFFKMSKSILYDPKMDMYYCVNHQY